MAPPAPAQSGIVCSSCGSNNVTITSEQTKSKGKVKGNGVIYKFVRLMLIICTGGLWLLVSKRKGRVNTKFKNETVGICQNCAHRWTIKGR